jgi:NAD(P)-dependent dehydrogenase (short-subunit alcohol dehydrogenase family)
MTPPAALPAALPVADPDRAVPAGALARVALVTGAAKRLGREIALTLARQGWDVAVHCRHSVVEAEQTAQDIRALGRRACVVAADLSDEALCRALVPQVLTALGQLDAVVNSASTFEYDNTASFSYAMLERHLRANTAPAIVLAQALADHLSSRADANADGAVVNLLDQKLWNPNPDFLSYTLSKAALESATTLLALALAPRVRVLGVAPGLTLTSDGCKVTSSTRCMRSRPWAGRPRRKTWRPPWPLPWPTAP